MRRTDLRAQAPEQVRHYVERGFWTAETLPHWLGRHAAARPDHPALVGAGARLTYGELAGRVRALAAGLRAEGLRAGDVVAVQLPNVPEFLVAHLAISVIGGVVQTLHMPYRAADLEPLLVHSRARAVICLEAVKEYPTAEVMLDCRRRLPELRTVIVHGGAPGGTRGLADLAAHSAPTAAADPPEVDASRTRRAPEAADPYLLLYTSGTTASPKGVPLTYQNMLSNTRGAAVEFALTPADVILSAAPFSHLYGLFGLHLALCVGATSLLLPAFTPPDLARLIESGRPTFLLAGPAHLASCEAAGLFQRHDVASLRHVVISGSACPPELAETVDARLPTGTVLQLWGMTELQAGSFTRPGDPAAIRHGSAGAASPGTELRVVGEDGGVLESQEEGELEVRGCSVFTGYFDNDAATLAAFSPDGWFRTGDLARLGPEGRLTLTGRVKDVINRGGVKFNPADVESLVGRLPGVAECAIVPVPDPVLGERACCFVLPREGATVTLEAIRGHLAAHHVAKNKWPEQLELVREMPMTPTRKVIKSRLRPPTP